jgi:hypothetical protein
MEGEAFRLKKIWILKDFKDLDLMGLAHELSSDSVLTGIRPTCACQR